MPILLICSRISLVADVRILALLLAKASNVWHITVQAQDQVRKGPTSVTEFEVSLADM